MAKHIRRTHSFIDRLPEEVAATVNKMIVDGIWPMEHDGDIDRKPTYENVVEYLTSLGYSVSHSAVGRYAKRLSLMTRMKDSANMAREVMQDINPDNASAAQKAVAEMMTAQMIDFIASNQELEAKEIMAVSRAIKDCAYVAIKSDEYIRKIREKANEVAEKTEGKLKGTGIDRKKIQEIVDDILGIAQ